MTSHASTPRTPHSLRGYFIVLLSQKDQNVGSCDSPHAPHRPRRGVGMYGHCIIFTKLALLDYIFCFLAVVLIPHSCVRQRTKNRLPAKETDADGFSAIHQKI